MYDGHCLAIVRFSRFMVLIGQLAQEKVFIEEKALAWLKDLIMLQRLHYLFLVL